MSHVREVKRALDFLASSIGLLMLSPVLLLIGLAVRLGDGGPALFAHRRVGQGGTPFRMWKFRTMVTDAERRGGALTVGGDRRITRVGSILRASKVDELPQLFNVLVGQMSLVGPRPEVETYVALYKVSERDVLKLKPGITDPASFAFYDESALLARAPDPEDFYRTRLLPEKCRINLEYAARAGFFTDLLLILATVAKILGLHLDIFRLLKLRRPDPGEFA